MVGKECKMQRTRLDNMSTANLSTLSLFCLCAPSTALTVTAWWTIIQFPVQWLNFRQGSLQLERSPYPEGRVVRSPRAGKSKGRQNEYFK